MTITANRAVRLETLLGADRVLSSESEAQKYAIEGRAPAAIVKPANAEQAAEIVRFAASEHLAVVCCGSRSKLQIGMPPRRYDLAVDLSNLTEIAHYDPADLTLSVGAGLPLAALAKVVATKGQFLPLSVPCFSAATVGGTVASGVDSMLRLQYGTSRDFLIGAEFIDGKGQLCKSGGRVVKNVTGYDIHKLLIGSLGTLAAITRLNFRTFPLPEVAAGFLVSFATSDTALSFRKVLLNSGLPFSSVELFDPGFGGLLRRMLREGNTPAADLLEQPEWIVYVAFSGQEGVVRRIHHESQHRAIQSGAATREVLDQASNECVNAALREAFAWLRESAPNAALLRVAQQQFAPDDLADLGKTSQPCSQRSALLLDGCGVCLVALLCEDDSENERELLARQIDNIFSRAGGKAATVTLLDAPAWLKS